MVETNLLIIDDNQTARSTLSALLTRSGYHIFTASSGSEGLAIVDELHPDVILLDVMMPEMDGFEVCRRLRQNPTQSEVPIIMITALDDRESRLEGLAAGADDFLSKPFDSLELEIRLKNLQQVNRYHRLQEEREKLQQAYALLQKQNQELELLSRKMIEVQEIERRRLAMELHDDLGQLITGLKMTLENARLNKNNPEKISQALVIVDQLLKSTRELAINLRPTILDDLGLFAALDWLFKRFTQQTQIKIVHNVDPLMDLRFSPIIETTAFRIIQEALTNTARHAGVNEISILVAIEPHSLNLSIIDQGRGFTVEDLSPGDSTGISAMQERVSWAGGRLHIVSSPGEGTSIQVEFPFEPKEQG